MVQLTDTNLYGKIRNHCLESIQNSLAELGLKDDNNKIILIEPPSPDWGELSTSISFEIARQNKRNPREFAEELSTHIKVSQDLIETWEVAGKGYINFKINFNKIATQIVQHALEENSAYGYIEVTHPLTIIVEHTSVNPVHPIHIGQARNPILGDALARLLEKRNHRIQRHYYVDGQCFDLLPPKESIDYNHRYPRL